MSYLISFATVLIKSTFQILVGLVGRDRKALIIERRTKVLALLAGLRDAGMTVQQLRDAERSLTIDQEE